MVRVKQKSASHCGPAVLEMLLSYLDIKVHQDAFVTAAKVQKKLPLHGMNIHDLSIAVKKLVPQSIFWYKRDATIGLINTILTKYKYPVGVEWQGLFRVKHEQEDNGHYSIATGIDKDMELIYLADPFWTFSKRDRRIDLTLFKKRWWDYNVINDRNIRDERMIFLITPKKVTFPKDLGMHRA